MPKKGDAKSKASKKNNNKIIIVGAVAVIIILAFLAGRLFQKEDSSQDIKECAASWQCSEWSDCVSKIRTRVCSDSNNCNTAEGKPAESESCTFQSKTFEVGKELLSYNILYKIDRVKTIDEIGYYSEGEFNGRRAQGVYYIVEMTIENKRDQSMDLPVLPIRIVDSNDNEYDYDILAENFYNADGIVAFTNKTVLRPRVPVQGVKIFDLPKDATGLQLKMRCCELVSKVELFDLGI